VKGSPAYFRFVLASHLRHTPRKHGLWLLDNGGSGEEVAAIARAAVAAHPGRVDYIRYGGGESELAMVNAAAVRVPGDVVVCAGGGRVFPRWLQELRLAAYGGEDVAVASPLVGMCNALCKVVGEGLMDGLGYDDVQEVIEEFGGHEDFADVPISAAGCFYLRRDALASLGYFDAGQWGFLREGLVDFCGRGESSGWRQVACVASIMLPLSKAPGATFDCCDRLEGISGKMKTAVRLRLDERRAARTQVGGDARPAVLSIVFRGGGGTPQTSWDLAAEVARHVRSHVLEVGADQWQLWHVVPGGRELLWRRGFTTIIEAGDPPDAVRRQALLRLVGELGVGMVHLRHFLNLPPEVVGDLRDMGLPVVVSLHDFHTLCPNGHLFDASGKFCGADCGKHFAEPDTGPDCKVLSMNEFRIAASRLRPERAVAWRQRTGGILARANAVVTTSPFAANLLAAKLPGFEGGIEVIEHGRDLAWQEPPQADCWPPKGALRLGVVGHINEMKGGCLLRDLGEQVALSGMRCEWHFVGTAERGEYRPPGSIDHGPYKREALPRILRAISPHVVLVPTVFMETYCHVLTEVWSCGFPVVANDQGALGERIRRHGGGWLVARPDADAWLEVLRKLMEDDEGYRRRLEEIRRMQPRTVAEMAADYLALYQRTGLELEVCE